MVNRFYKFDPVIIVVEQVSVYGLGDERLVVWVSVLFALCFLDHKAILRH